MRPIVYLVAAPAPYRNAEMDRAASLLGPDALRLVFAEARNVGGSWQHQMPKACPWRVIDAPSEHGGLAQADLARFLEEQQPKVVVVGGHSYAAMRTAMRWCVARGVPYALRSDANVWSDRKKGLARHLLRRVRLGYWLRRASKVLLTGRFNRQAWERLGLRPEQHGWWPQWIDYDHYESAVALRRQRETLRAEFGLKSPFHLVYVGRLIPRKRVDLLCEAVAAGPPHVGLAVAGLGPLEQSLRDKYGPRLGERLRMLGAVEPDQLPRLYAACDALALASGPSEPWGMVLNEAAAAGLPIVCHRHVGAAGDLLEDGGNGIALSADTVAHWRAAVERLSGDHDQWLRFSARSREIAAAWRRRSDPAECLAALLNPRRQPAGGAAP